MVKKTSQPSEKVQPMLKVPREVLLQEIASQIETGRGIASREIASRQDLEAAEGDYRKWSSYNAELLRQRFSTSEFVDTYNESWGIAFIGGPSSLGEDISDFRDRVRDKVERLESISARIPLIPESPDAQGKANHQVPRRQEGTASVFVVHGHDEGVKQAVARFIENLGLRPIILAEQAGGGMTIIEKMESYSNVSFAVVLLTPDDYGSARGKEQEMRPRARQNVILELGYFLGRLGRARVCPLYVAGVELPSDYHGVEYLPYDSGDGWKLRLAKELKAAGIPIDMNRVIE